MANKISSNHIKFEKHKMNVRLAAQTLNSSVADAIEFLDIGMKNPNFKNSNGTVKFVKIIDRLFDMLNSRNPIAKGYKQPPRLANKATYEEILRSTAEYLLSLKTNSTPSQLLATHRRKTFIVGFVTNIKSTIEMANQIDHLELLFSCIRARGGWNNNPNCLQLKYALRQMMMKNAIAASKNGNCQDFADNMNTLIPIFHKRKHKSPLSEVFTQDGRDECTNAMEESEERLMFEHLNQNTHSDFIFNILFYIGGFIVKCPN